MDVDKLWKILDSNQGQIRAFDAKAQIVIAIDGVLAGFFGAQTVKLAELLASQPTSFWSVLLWLTGLICIGLLAWSIMFAVSTVHPRLKLDQPNSRIFFAHIYDEFKCDYQKAREVLTSITDEELKEDLANQILAIAIICSTKAKRFKFALFTMCAAVLVWIFTLFFQFAVQQKVTDQIIRTQAQAAKIVATPPLPASPACSCPPVHNRKGKGNGNTLRKP